MENFSFEKSATKESSKKLTKEKLEEPPHSQKPNNILFQTEPKTEKGSFFIPQKYFDNDLPPLKALKVEIISKIPQCLKLWQEFSPQKTLFDTWEFRYAFYKSYKYKPYFILLKNQAENLALLPLWHDTLRKQYFWFGSNWQEEVSFFSKDANFIPVLISLAPSPCELNAISKESADSIKDKISFKRDDSKYVLNLEGFKNHEDYLMTLKKNNRRNLRKDRNKVVRLNPEIIIDNFSDYDDLVELSRKRFEEKGEDTDWEDPRRVETFRQVIKLTGKSYKARMISVKIGKKRGS